MTHEASPFSETDVAALSGGSSLPLLVWLSPGFPVGAFAYSHGLEAAVDAGDIHDAASLRNWLSDLLNHGAGHNDATLLAATWRAVAANDWPTLLDLNELALALSPSRERHLETSSQGNAFMMAVAAAWPRAAISRFRDSTADAAYVIALGVAAAGHGIPLPALLESALVAFVSNLVSAAVRLGPIGQTDGQGVIAELIPDIAGIASSAALSTIADLGGAVFRADIASMRHETQYSRLFRS